MPNWFVEAEQCLTILWKIGGIGISCGPYRIWLESICLSFITLSLQNNSLYAKFLVCFNIQSASMLLKVGENVVRVSNSLDPGETPSYSFLIYSLPHSEDDSIDLN